MTYLVPAIHPATVLHQGRPITDVIAADLGKAWRIANEGPRLEEHILYVTPGNPLGIETALRNATLWMQHWLDVGATLGVDIETSGLDYFNCNLYSIALADPVSKVAVSWCLRDLHTLPDSLEKVLNHYLVALLADESVTKIYHNAPFDRAVLQRKGYVINGRMFDTMALAHLVQPDIPHDLGWVGQTYLDCEPWKLDHQSGKMANTRNPVELLIYNAKDALYTALCAAPLVSDIHARGMSQNLISWQMAFTDLATNMEIRGIPVNTAKRKAMALEMKGRLARLKHEMQEYLGWSEFNPMHDGHRREVLFGHKYSGQPWNLGLQPTRLTKKKQVSSTSYKSIIDYLEHPFVRKLSDYVETRHVYATQFKDGTLRKDDDCPDTDEDMQAGAALTSKKGQFETPGSFVRATCEDGRFHPKWNPCGTTGSRMSSTPNGQNLRNPPRAQDKAVYETVEGRCLVAADKDQLELRLIAAKAGIGELLNAMNRGEDPHRLVARLVYGEEFDRRDARNQKLLRDMVKNVEYASVYLAGVETVWRTIRERKLLDPAMRAAMTLPVVKHIHASFFLRYPQIRWFHENNMRLIAKRGYMEIEPFGRRRYYPVQPPPLNEVANWAIQPLGSDIVTKEMVEIDHELQRLYHGTAGVILHGHDQIVIECEVRHAEAIRDMVKVMFGSSVVDGPAGSTTLTAKPKIGKSLLEVK